MLHKQLLVLFYQNKNFTETYVNFDSSTVFACYGDYYKKLAVYFFHEIKVGKNYLEFLHYHCIQRVSLAKEHVLYVTFGQHQVKSPDVCI